MLVRLPAGPVRRKGGAMRRIFVAGLVVSLCFSVIAVAGCGGETGKAKEYMKAADAGYKKVSARLESTSKALEPSIGAAVQGDYTKLTSQVLSDAEEAFSEASRQLPEIKKKYQEIKGLKGVEDYVAYAEDMIKGIDTTIKALDMAAEMVAKLKPLVEANDQVGIKQYFADRMPALLDTQSLNTQANKYFEEAASFKSRKGLGD